LSVVFWQKVICFERWYIFMDNMVLSLLVDNTSGVLSRVSGLFSRRGYNIDSVTVGVTENPAYSRMTVAVSGDNTSLSQIKKQLNKLEDVVEIVELEPGRSVCRELVLVKVKSSKETRQDIISIADIFRANIVDVAKGSMMIELTGTTSKVEAFLNLLDGFEIVELVRTGLTGLVRG
jgi:acetolactate synthase-1/3 small subunit